MIYSDAYLIPCEDRGRFRTDAVLPGTGENRNDTGYRKTTRFGRIFMLFFMVILVFSVLGEHPVSGAPSLKLNNGDRVAFIGNTFFERDYKYARIETVFTLRYPEKRIVFRNLGWSGDTVNGKARAYFGNAEKGFAHLMKTVDRIDPTVMLVAYGSMASYRGKSGLDSFRNGYARLLDELEKHTGRIALIGPVPHEPGPSPLSREKVETNNRHRDMYNKTIQKLAKKRDHLFIDLPGILKKFMERSEKPLTDNGVHLNAYGYLVVARILANAVQGRPIDSKHLAEHSSSPERNKLRRVIRRKNELFFRRWRPSNTTYLYFFRKHEQGQNASEIPKFDPLIKRQEKRIEKMKKRVGSKQ